MNREELIDMIIDHSAGATDNVADGVCFKTLADSILKCLSLPPAEGAEKLKEMEELFNLEQQLDIPMKDRFHNSAKGKALFDAIYGKQQPTAEGAEEILANHIDKESMDELSVNVWPDMLEAMQEYATLHAQRIADKMVSERLREELMAYDKFLSNTYWGVSHLVKRDEAVDEYLKTREK